MLVPERNPNFEHDSEKPPLLEYYTVLDWWTIEKSRKWWVCLVLCVPADGGARELRFYGFVRSNKNERGWSAIFKRPAKKWDWEGLSKTAEDFCVQCGA